MLIGRIDPLCTLLLKRGEFLNFFMEQSFGTLPSFNHQYKAAMHYIAQSVGAHAFMEGKIVDF